MRAHDGDRRERLALAAVVAAGVAPFASSVGHGFAYDDVHTVWAHPGVVGRFSLREIFLRDFWGEPLGSAHSLGSYRPVATLTLWIDQHLGSGAAWPFHLTNLALYALLLVAAHQFLVRFMREELGRVARLLAIALFATLAIHVEVVANATGRAELLAALLSLLSLTAALSGRVALFGVLLATAVLSKESAYPMALLAPFLVARRGDARTAKRTGLTALAVIAIAVLVRAKYLQFRRVDPQMTIDNPLVFAGFGERIAGVMDVFGRYVGHTATGIELCPDYGYGHFIPGASPWPGVVVALGLVALLVATARRNPRIADLVVAFAASYAVVSHVFLPASILLAERVFFFPSFFLIALATASVAALLRARARLAPIVAGAAVVFALLQIVFTITYLPAWRNDHALAAYAVRSCPRVLRMRMLAIDSAKRRNAIDDGAWAALAAAAIWVQRPNAIPEDYFPDGIEELPYAARIAALRARTGGSWPIVLQQALSLSRQLGFDAAATRLASYGPTTP